MKDVKKIHIIFLTVYVILNFICLNPTKNVLAADLMDVDDYDLSDVQKVLDDEDYKEIDFVQMVKKLISGESNTVLTDTITYVFEKSVKSINFYKNCVINILCIALVSAFFTNFARAFNENGVSDSGFYVCYIAIMTVALTVFSTSYNIAIDIIKMIIEFMQALIPSFFLSVGIIGQSSAMGFYQVTIIVIYFVEYIFLNVVMPSLKVYLILAMANNISKEDTLSRAVKLIKKAILFLNKSLLTVVVGMNVIQGLVLPSVDNVKNSAIRKLAGTLPVVGESSDYITDVFLGSGMLIKNSLGGVAIIVILCICIIPTIKLFTISASLQISAAIVQPVSDSRLSECIVYVGEVISMMLKCVMTIVILFVVTIAIVCIVTNIR